MNYYLSKLMLYHLVNQMKREGFSIQKIAEHYEINWRTAKRMLEISDEEFQFELDQNKGRKPILYEYETFVKDKLQLYPSTPAAQMHDWLKEFHQDFPTVDSKTVFNFVQTIRGKYRIPKIEPVRDYVSVPELAYGLQAQVDFGFYNMKTTLGKTQKVQFFTFILARSRYKYILFSDIAFTMSLPHF